MKISIIGCGNMGLIYARAFIKYNIVKKENLLLVEKNKLRCDELATLNIGRVTVITDKLIGESDIIFLCVKPQDFSHMCDELKAILSEKNILISIMAGISIEKLATVLDHHNIIRAMPNSPAELGMGMTAFAARKTIQPELIHKAENLLSTTGRTFFLHDEKMLDTVTALSGSGPAYFFYIVKHMTDAGVKMGFDETTSALFVKQTMLGSFHLLNTSGKTMDELINAVASKGGTTEAALKHFEEQRVGLNIQIGIHKACDRAKELSLK